MRPKFVMFEVIGKDGDIQKIPINVNMVCAVVPATIAGMIDGPSGEKIGKAASALDFGVKMIPVNYSVKEAVTMLEGSIE